MKNISHHISYREGVLSNTATRLNIDNTPDGYQLGNMSAVALNIFEPLRDWVGGPVKINSFYIKDNLNFDQIIWEFGNDTNPDWVHISYISEDQNRNRCLKAERKNGKAVYSII